MNVDPDGMADLALVQSGAPHWLRTIERSTSRRRSMVLSSDFPHVGKDTTPPSVPTGLKAVASSGRTITLTWNASTDDTGGAVVYQVLSRRRQAREQPDRDDLCRPSGKDRLITRTS